MSLRDFVPLVQSLALSAAAILSRFAVPPLGMSLRVVIDFDSGDAIELHT